MIRYRPILEGSTSEKSLKLSSGSCEPAVPGRLLVSSEEPFESPTGDPEPSVSDAFFVSSIFRSLTTIDCGHDDQAERLSHLQLA